MTTRRVVAVFACILPLALSLSMQPTGFAQGTTCAPEAAARFLAAKADLEAVRDAIATDRTLGTSSRAFTIITTAIADFQGTIDTITGANPCEFSEDETEDFFEDQEEAIEGVMDIPTETRAGALIVAMAEAAVRKILDADEFVVITLLTNFSEEIEADSGGSGGLDWIDLTDAQALQDACALPTANVVCAPEDVACDRDGSTCDNAVEAYSDLFSAIIEIIQ